jgi:TolB-like protein
MTVVAHPLPVDEARDALGRVLAGRPFRRSHRLTQMLRYLAEETFAGRGAQLRERSIAVEALGCPESFDPRFDPTVRVLASRVRKALDRYYEVDGAQDPVRLEVPRGGYAVHARPADAPPADPVGMEDASPVVAVATLVDLTADPSLGHLSVGLSEAVVANLTSFRGLRTVGPIAPSAGEDVASWTRSLHAAFGATHVLLGTTRSADATVRVAVRLAEVESGQTVWSQHFDHDLGTEHLFEVEDRIARRVSGTLGDYGGVVHRQRDGRPTRPAGAYDAMLRFYRYLSTLDPAEAPAATEALELAVSHDPDDSLLLAMLAGMVLFGGVGRLGDVGGASMSADDVARATDLARRSLRIDPTNAHAIAVEAFVALLHGDDDRCRLQLDRVLELQPSNPSLVFMVGVGHAMSGDWSAGIHHIEEAMELNPLHPGWFHGFVVLDALLHGDPGAALAAAQRVDTPGLVWGATLRAAALAASGRLDDAQAQLRELDAAALALPDPAAEPNAFASHLRLPDEVVAALVDALAKIPPTPTSR